MILPSRQVSGDIFGCYNWGWGGEKVEMLLNISRQPPGQSALALRVSSVEVERS